MDKKNINYCMLLSAIHSRIGTDDEEKPALSSFHKQYKNDQQPTGFLICILSFDAYDLYAERRYQRFLKTMKTINLNYCSLITLILSVVINVSLYSRFVNQYELSCNQFLQTIFSTEWDYDQRILVTHKGKTFWLASKFLLIHIAQIKELMLGQQKGVEVSVVNEWKGRMGCSLNWLKFSWIL
jgi:hypothetical protein